MVVLASESFGEILRRKDSMKVMLWSLPGLYSPYDFLRLPDLPLDVTPDCLPDVLDQIDIARSIGIVLAVGVDHDVPFNGLASDLRVSRHRSPPPEAPR